MGLRQLTIVGGLLLAAGEAKVLKWQRDQVDWVPAKDTSFAALEPMAVMTSAPEPTNAPSPEVVAELKARQQFGANTCAFVNGIPIAASAITCGAQAYCSAADKVNSVIACCIDNTCAPQTTCYDRTESASFNGDFLRTLFCSNTAAPSCALVHYTDPVYSGFEALICAATATTYFVSAAAVQSSAGGTTPSPSRSLPSSRGGSTTDSFSSESTSPSTPAPAPASNNTGAIVGGVVGGVGGIALIGLGVFFLLRNKKKHEAQNAANTDPAGAGGAVNPYGSSPGQPQMVQHVPTMQASPTAAGFAPMDNRMSIAKPPYGSQPYYDPSMASSPPGSPPPQSPTPPAYGFPPQNPQHGMYPQSYQQQYQQPSTAGYHMANVPPPQSPPTHVMHEPVQQQHMYQPAQQQQHAAELPTTRGDGQLQELA